MKELLIASNNQHKAEEIRLFLSTHFDAIYTLADKDIVCEPKETGNCFYENALIKARAVAQFINMPILADDTGLCVDALGGQPGIFSARYAGSEHDNNANRKKLLRVLRGTTNRKAHFETVVVLLYPDGRILSGEGRVDGHIMTEEHGKNGFGYDSIFFCDELNKSFAEATVSDKMNVSHRGRALRDLLSKITG